MKKMFICIFLLVFILPLFAQTNKAGAKKKMTIESSAFKNNEMIPDRHANNKGNISPQLKWSGEPKGVKSFALIADDPDAPIGDWVHWVLFNIPSDVHELNENILPEQKFPNGMISGKNDWGNYGYNGPQPPSGTHRYFFKVYALDSLLKLAAGATKKDLLKAMEKHILAHGELIGKYSKK